VASHYATVIYVLYWMDLVVVMDKTTLFLIFALTLYMCIMCINDCFKTLHITMEQHIDNIVVCLFCNF